MNRGKAAEVAELLKAYAEGATLQVRESEEDEWVDATDPTYLYLFQWRIKP